VIDRHCFDQQVAEWVMPIILAIQKGEIETEGQPVKKVSTNLISTKKPCMVVHT
jgi:hypothetical protein